MLWPCFLGCFLGCFGAGCELPFGLGVGTDWGLLRGQLSRMIWGSLWAGLGGARGAGFGVFGAGLCSLTLSVSPSSAAAPGERWGGPGRSPRGPPARTPRPAPPYAGAAPAALPGAPQHGEVRPRPLHPIGPAPCIPLALPPAPSAAHWLPGQEVCAC